VIAVLRLWSFAIGYQVHGLALCRCSGALFRDAPQQSSGLFSMTAVYGSTHPFSAVAPECTMWSAVLPVSDRMMHTFEGQPIGIVVDRSGIVVAEAAVSWR